MRKVKVLHRHGGVNEFAFRKLGNPPLILQKPEPRSSSTSTSDVFKNTLPANTTLPHGLPRRGAIGIGNNESIWLPLRVAERFKRGRRSPGYCNIHFQKMGFTLVELLVVVVIIGILATLLLPVANSVLKSAQQTECVSNLRQLVGALLSFRADNNGQVVPYQVGGSGGLNPSGMIDAYLSVEKPVIGSCQSHVWSCPANPARNSTDNSYKWPWGDAVASYALNENLEVGGTNYHGQYAANMGNAPHLIMILERSTSTNPWSIGIPATALTQNYYISSNSTAGFFKHPSGNSVGFVDGHVESWTISHEGFSGTNGKGDGVTAYMRYWLPQSQ